MSPSPNHLSPEAMAGLPRHVAIIMDGNGRWAKERHLPRVEGHREGAESVRAVIRTAGELGIKYLTLYAFSVENWNRPKDEVDTLMKYLAHYMKTEFAELNRNNVRLEVIGQIHRLPEFVQKQLKKTQDALAKNNGLTLIMALSYGGRTEIVEAVRSIAAKVKRGELEPADITEQVVADHLYTRKWSRIPDVLDPHQRRNARQQFSVVADFVRGTGGHDHALAGFSQGPILRRLGRIPPPPSPVRGFVIHPLTLIISRVVDTPCPTPCEIFTGVTGGRRRGVFVI